MLVFVDGRAIAGPSSQHDRSAGAEGIGRAPRQRLAFGRAKARRGHGGAAGTSGQCFRKIKYPLALAEPAATALGLAKPAQKSEDALRQKRRT